MRDKPTQLHVDAMTAIPLCEIWQEFAHASGPGGQHVNKASTQVTLCFCLAQSSALTPMQKTRISSALRNRINQDGVLRVTCREHRSQTRNRSAALDRLRDLLAGALRTPRPRRPTRPTGAARERRLRAKQRRAAVKKQRRPPPEWE